MEAYGYDANGNRTLKTSTEAGVEAESATYTAGDQLEGRDDTTYDYDANGRLSGKVEETDAGPAVTTYVYGSQGQLLQVDTPDTSIEYRHNALGQRVAKLIDGDIVERYLWQDLTTLLATYDGSGNLKQRFQYTAGHTPTSFTQSGQRYYIQTDHLGSPRAVTDSSGTVVKEIRYDSYGNIINDSNPEFQIPFGFAGGLHDADTGLVRFGFRDYDPEAGRWTARDPIGFDGGDTNLYGYVLNNPISFYDLDGLELSSVDQAAVAVVSDRHFTSTYNREVGGRVLQSWINSDSISTTTVVGQERSVYVMDAPIKLFHSTVATFHVHPDGEVGNYFSQEDIWNAESRLLPTYVSGDSRILKYDPVILP
ncbi:RHS repeat domain-containing protein [Marinimicrobium sp. C2-29]|uniref:RHS repeat domain-containing protein n=1 Tax=Marinimicrobium sp. C2-29 TaxID=3139825 RepID=UPI0031396FD9